MTATSAFEEAGLKRVWWLSLIVSVWTVALLLAYINLANWHEGIPLGYDSFYYVGYINQVIASGPLQFAASQHYVEFLYPIVASIPVYLGASADTVEIVLPILLACATVVAAGVLALEARDTRIAILTVASSGGWFAIYRMSADFHGNLLAFPLLLLATTLLLRAARVGNIAWKSLGTLLVLVAIAASAHVESTDFFLVTWFVAFILFGRPEGSVGWKSSSLMIASATLVTSPFTLAYLPEGSGLLNATGGQYCIFPPYWLEVFGPLAGLAILGLVVLIWSLKTRAIDRYFDNFLLFWAVLAMAVGVLGYVTDFPIVFSDRSLLLAPIPLVTSVGTLWLLNRFPRVQRLPQARLLTILAIGIPLLSAAVVFGYAAPHFRYFADHGPSLVVCAR